MSTLADRRTPVDALTSDPSVSGGVATEGSAGSASAAASAGSGAAPPRALSRARARVRAYVTLTKPRIVELLLVTTVPTMFLAARGLPDLWLTVVVVVGGALAAGAANTFNCYID